MRIAKNTGHDDKNLYKSKDLVLIKNETGSKLEQKFEGPYEVLEDLGSNLRIKIKDKIDIIHKNRIRKFI